jgi:hypothetical protein
VDGGLVQLGWPAALLGVAVGVVLWLSGRIKTKADYDELKAERDRYRDAYEGLLEGKGQEERELLEKFAPLLWEANKTAESLRDGLESTVDKITRASPRRNDVDVLVRRLEHTVDQLTELTREGGAQ